LAIARKSLHISISVPTRAEDVICVRYHYGVVVIGEELEGDPIVLDHICVGCVEH
jgi:hypothetical protein